MRLRGRWTLAPVALGLALAGSPVRAAGPSIYCAQTKPIVICTNAELLALDAELTHAYEARRGSLSGEAAEKLAIEQGKWPEYRDIMCLSANTTVACLAKQYRLRIAELDPAGPPKENTVRVVHGGKVCIGPHGIAVPLPAGGESAGNEGREHCGPEVPPWAKGWAEPVAFFCARNPDYAGMCDRISEVDAKIARIVAEKARSLPPDEADTLVRRYQQWLAHRQYPLPTIQEYKMDLLNYDNEFSKRYTEDDLVQFYEDVIHEVTITPIELVYGADDKLCPLLVDAFNQIQARYLKAFYPRSPIGLPNQLEEQAHGELMRTPGLSEPTWLTAADPGLKEYADFGHSPRAFFRVDVAGDGQQRLVALHDWINFTTGDFHTDVWILKPGSGYREKTAPAEKAPAGFPKTIKDVDPDVVDLLVNFYGRPWDYPFKYPFVRLPNTRVGFAAASKPSREAEKIAGFSGNPAPQTAVIYGGRLYFVVGTPALNYGMVYRITPEITAEIACVTATRAGYEYVKSITK